MPSDSAVQVMIAAVALLAVVVAVGYYSASLRRAGKEKELTPEDMLAIFGDMFSSGALTEKEFRQVRQYLGDLIIHGEKLGIGRPRLDGMTVTDIIRKARETKKESEKIS